MKRDRFSMNLEENHRLVESYRTWTARAFCMVSAEGHGSPEPCRPATQVSPRESRRASALLQIIER